MAKLTRLDILVVQQGLLPTRQAAQAAIIDGGVIVDGQKVTKPGTPTKDGANIELTAHWKGSSYVSRGGLKLERALDYFGVKVEDRICLDLGASTGGFTDCLLKRGAHLVYAIDVGYGQLDWALRQSPRVVVRERTNARFLTKEGLYENETLVASLAVADLSFISLLKILPACMTLLQEDAEIVALVKPQFEAGRALVGKGGVVRSKEVHVAVLKDVVKAAADLGLVIINMTHSPIKGPAGNIEFLAYWRTCGIPKELDFEALVEEAHAQLNAIK